MADLMEKPAIALLAVSDNSATGDQLLLRSDDQKAAYDNCRKCIIPKLIIEIANISSVAKNNFYCFLTISVGNNPMLFTYELLFPTWE